MRSEFPEWVNEIFRLCFNIYFTFLGPKFLELNHDGKKYAFTDSAFSSDSCAIVTSSNDGQIKIWDSETGEFDHRFYITRTYLCYAYIFQLSTRWISAAEMFSFHQLYWVIFTILKCHTILSHSDIF